MKKTFTKILLSITMTMSFAHASCNLFVHPNSEHNIIADQEVRDIIAQKGYEIVSDIKGADFELFSETKLLKSTGNQMLGSIFYTKITFGEYKSDNSGAHYQEGHATEGAQNSISETLNVKLITCSELEQRLGAGDRDVSKQIYQKRLELGIF